MFIPAWEARVAAEAQQIHEIHRKTGFGHPGHQWDQLQPVQAGVHILPKKK